MILGLRLEGRRDASDPAAFLERATQWLAEREAEPRPRVELHDDEGRRFVAVELHPGAEPLILEATETGATLSASTVSAGPGYHRYVCALAAELADALDLTWTKHEDPSGFVTSGDDDALERAMLASVTEVTTQVLELVERGHKGIALFMPMGHSYEHDGVIATVLGPRDEAWLRAVVDEPRRASDIFPWWSEGRDGRYYLDLARVHLWLDVRWRPPVDDEERALLDRIATWIERAHAMDPELPIPWDEQAELLALLGEESLRATRAQLKAQSLPAVRRRVGYRRNPVRVTLSGGWTMRVPGELAERWEERGTWVAWDERRSLWFTSMTVQPAPGEPEPSTDETLAGLPPLTGDEPLELERGELRGLACFVEDTHEGEPILRLEAHAASGPHAAVGTIVLTRESDREWALETWASLGRAR